ncbi:hypothetical protein [Streptomyces exfoliatus]|uniref:hypothetical protein n=1 Tax=Streptomyces exfoliatus TaxID=1905 RepID=UPI003792345D
MTIVPADTALRAGWALTSRDRGEKVKYRYRPHYFAEVWRPGEASRVFPLACKGNHGNSAASADQLASASVHTEAVHIGAWNETPALLFSTEIPTEGARWPSTPLRRRAATAGCPRRRAGSRS